jgi:hypothetical protein
MVKQLLLLGLDLKSRTQIVNDGCCANSTTVGAFYPKILTLNFLFANFEREFSFLLLRTAPQP